MTQILIIDSDLNLRTILKLNLMKTLGLNIIEKNTASEAVALLEILPTVSLVICRDKILEEESASLIANYFTSKHTLIPLIIMGKNTTQYPQVCVVDVSASWKIAIEMVAQVLGMRPNWEENLIAQDFVPISISHFLNIHQTSIGCDVYVRVKKEEGIFQYIKRLHSQDTFQRSDIEKYLAAGLTEFFITKESFPRFVNYVTSKFVSQLDQTSIMGKERLQLTAESYEITRDRIHSIGIDEATIEIVHESIKSMQTCLKDGSALDNFLQMLQANQLTYLYAHSYFSCLLLHGIVGQFSWNSAQVRDKLTYLAYFHDISLEEEYLVKINTLEDFTNFSFKKHEKEKVLNHAFASSQIVDRFAEIPLGVSVLIREHHGMKNGIGFPGELNLKIGPVSMMFMVIEAFVDQFLQLSGDVTKEQLQEIYTKLKTIYNKSTYQQTLAALEALTLGRK